MFKNGKIRKMGKYSTQDRLIDVSKFCTSDSVINACIKKSMANRKHFIAYVLFKLTKARHTAII